MKVSAGKVAIRPRGDYATDEGYRRLDLVRYKNGAYVCRKSCIGEAPTNEEFWMALFIEENRIEIDSELSETSTNPVQNDVVTQAMYDIQRVIENLPKDEPIAIDEAMNTESRNPVQNKVVTQAINDIKNIVENLHIGSGGEVDLGGYATDVDNLKKSIEAIDTNLETINADLELCKGKIITTKYQNGKLYGRTDENGEWVEITVDSGKDVVVPTIEVSGNTLIVTDKDGVHSYELPGGGATEGAAGFSPTVAIDGNKITVTDKEGSHEYEINHIDEEARQRLDELESLLANAEITNKQPMGTDKNAKLGPVTEQGIKSEGGYVYVNWKDPDDVIVDGEVTARWAGTKIVRKEGSAPESVEDGAVDNHTYRMNGAEPCRYVLSTGVHYYFAIYPYTVSGVYSDPVVIDIDLTTATIPKPEVIDDGKAVKVDATSCKIKFTKGANTESVALMYRKGEVPKSLIEDGTTVIRGITSGTVIKGLDDASTYYFKLVSIGTDGTKVKGDTFVYQTEVEIVSFADGTWKQIGKMLDAHYAGIIDIADYWEVGDERVINVDAIPESKYILTKLTSGDNTLSGYVYTEDMSVNGFYNGKDDIIYPSFPYNSNTVLRIVALNADRLPDYINERNKAAVTIMFKHPLSKAMQFSNGEQYSFRHGICSWMEHSLRNALPISLQSLIKTVLKKHHVRINGRSGFSFTDVSLNIFSISAQEINPHDSTLDGLMTSYPEPDKLINLLITLSDGTRVSAFTSSCLFNDGPAYTSNTFYITTFGGLEKMPCTNKAHISPMFCI